jgi:hypothetical protein
MLDHDHIGALVHLWSSADSKMAPVLFLCSPRMSISLIQAPEIVAYVLEAIIRHRVEAKAQYQLLIRGA